MKKICEYCKKEMNPCKYAGLIKYHPECRKEAYKKHKRNYRKTQRGRKKTREIAKRLRDRQNKTFKSLSEGEKLEAMNKIAKKYLEKYDEMDLEWKPSQK